MSDTTTTAREFHIGDIISVTSGKLVSPRHIAGVHELLDHLTGDVLLTHQLPRASRECEGRLREQHPDLAAIEVPDWSDVPRDQIETAVMTWIAAQADEHGSTRQVQPLPADDHTRIDPIAELRMLRPDAEIITVNLDGEAQS